MRLDILAEYIKLTNKRIKFPWHKRRIADLLTVLKGGVVDHEAPEYRSHSMSTAIEYPYTADELRVDYEKRVYDGRAQRKPW